MFAFRSMGAWERGYISCTESSLVASLSHASHTDTHPHTYMSEDKNIPSSWKICTCRNRAAVKQLVKCQTHVYSCVHIHMSENWNFLSSWKVSLLRLSGYICSWQHDMVYKVQNHATTFISMKHMCAHTHTHAHVHTNTHQKVKFSLLPRKYVFVEVMFF